MQGKDRDRDFIMIIRRDVIEKLCFDDILFFESQGRKVYVHTQEKVVGFNGSMKDTQKDLDGRFYSCHGSFVVNLAKVIRFQESGVILEGGETVPVSQRKRGETAKRFVAYFDEHFPCNSKDNIV